jgi:hypothetical protein
MDRQSVCFDTQGKPVENSIFENKYFQSCHTHRTITRAGFESAPLVSIEKGYS